MLIHQTTLSPTLKTYFNNKFNKFMIFEICDFTLGTNFCMYVLLL